MQNLLPIHLPRFQEVLLNLWLNLEFVRVGFPRLYTILAKSKRTDKNELKIFMKFIFRHFFKLSENWIKFVVETGNLQKSWKNPINEAHTRHVEK